jgi:sigma-B regulation protein RsbU (phosphoserine phosphatase)
LGDTLILASDGVDEAMNEAQDYFGFDRLKEVLRTCRHKRAFEIHASVIEAVTAFRGKANQSDDITLIVIKRQ